MADNNVQLAQEASFPKPAMRIYLYKVARDSGLWKFNHDFTNMANGPTGPTSFVATGGDPADMDLPSRVVHRALSGVTFGRLPFDSWIPRKTNIPIQNFTGQPTGPGGTEAQKLKEYYALEDMDRTNILLNWKNLYGSDFSSNFTKFFKNRKAELISQLSALMTTFSATPDGRFKALNRYDLTNFLIRYTHDTTTQDLANTLDIELASDPAAFFASGTAVHLETSANIGSFGGEQVGSSSAIGVHSDATIPLVEENDIVEMRVKYLDSDNSRWEIQESGFIDADGYQRVFIGFVTSMVRTTQYNNQEKVNLVAAGSSKIFSLYDTSFVPSVALSATESNGANMYEAGTEINDTQFSIFANRLNGMSADQIFDGFMRNALFCQKLGETAKTLPELQSELETKQAELAKYTNGAQSTDPKYNPKTEKDKKAAADARAQLTKDISELQAGIVQVKEYAQRGLKRVFDQNTLPVGANAVLPPEDLDIEYYTPMSHTDPKAVSFQFINYIPALMGLARQYAVADALTATGENVTVQSASDTGRTALLSSVMATVEQAGYIGYKAMMQTAFKMYQAELKRPSSIFSDVKDNTFLEMFEDRPGVIRLRPPKYNIINLNRDLTEYIHSNRSPIVALPIPHGPTVAPDMLEIALNAEYTIPASAIQSMSVNRDDVAIATRSDHVFEVPFNGQVLEGYSGHFTDAGYLLKYGLRTTGPQHNPMSLTPKIASVLSALRVATANADTRTIQLTVFNTREYRLGRLYYIPTSIPNSNDLNNNVVSKGVVGYITKISTALTYAQEAQHVLTLSYVRQAEVLAIVPPGMREPVYYANFKKLPDVATYMRLLATDGGFSTDADQAVNQRGDGIRDALNSNTTASYNGAMVLPNGMTKSALNSNIPAATYAMQLRAAGIKGDNFIPKDDSIDTEKNNFVTTISSAAVQDGSDVSMSKNLLAKLTLYDVDPLLKLYPAIKTMELIPETDTTKNRDTTDLLRVVYSIVKSAVDSRFMDNVAFSLDSLPSVSDVKDTGQLRYLRLPATSGADASIPGSPGSKRTIFVGTLSGGIGYPSQVVFAFVQTAGKVAMNKFFVFHVPYYKSARLSNLINTGTPPGCGYRRITTIKNLGSNPQAKSDMHAEGSAMVFSNLDVSAWGLADIIESCVELDFGPSTDINNVNGELTEAASDRFHLYNSFINAQLEPFNYVRSYNHCYNPSAVAAVPLSAQMVNDIVRMCIGAVPESVLGMTFPVQAGSHQNTGLWHNIKVALHFEDYARTPSVSVTEADHSSGNYLKNWMKQYVATRTEHILVPVANNYWKVLFTNIMAQKQPLLAGTPELYVSVMKKMSVTTNPKNSKSLLIGLPGTYLLENKTEKNANGSSAFSVDFSKIDKLQFAINSENFVLIPTGKYTSVRSFIDGSDPDYSMLCFQLIDSLALMAPATTDAKDNYRTRVQGNALSVLWHTSYGQTLSAFQSTLPVDQREPADMYRKLNLEGLVK